VLGGVRLDGVDPNALGLGIAIMVSPQRHDDRADDATEHDGDDCHAEVAAQA
jgi:hypothetical protein